MPNIFVLGRLYNDSTIRTHIPLRGGFLPTFMSQFSMGLSSTYYMPGTGKAPKYSSDSDLLREVQHKKRQAPKLLLSL